MKRHPTTPHPVPSHAGPAWLLRGLANTPGVLTLHAGRLAFTTDDGVVFDAPLDRVRAVTFPWYWFGGGFRAEIDGTRRRISLTRPNGAPSASSAVLGAPDIEGFELLTAAGGLHDAAAGRRRTRTWRTLLVP